MSLQTDLTAAVAQTAADGQLLHQIVHGDDQSQVQTDGGPVKTVAKAMADIDGQLQSSLVELDQKVVDAATSESNAATSESNASISEGNASTSTVTTKNICAE